jgi:hypothetical protein
MVKANDAIIEVQIADGAWWNIETTTNYFCTYSQAFTGWQFEVTTINR